MNASARLKGYFNGFHRASFKVLVVPLLLILASPWLGELFRVNTIEGWSFVVFALWSPLMFLHIWGGGKAWDDFKRRDYPKELALLALGLNILAPFLVIYFVLYV